VTRIDLEARDRSTILIHYYRAMVARADIWRTRMDATTHWAIAATAAVLSFVLGSADAPASALSIATLLTLAFLLLEARRLTFYHLWQRRVLLLEEGLVRPALSGGEAAVSDDPLRELLDEHLGRTVPRMPLRKAAARRFRRIYLYLFGVQVFAWALKLAQHPMPARSLAGFVERASLGPLPGRWVLPVAALVAVTAGVDLWRRGGVERARE